MEAGDATAVVGAILWLAQTIVETLQPGKLADWLDQVGLTDAIGELKLEVERLETVVNGVKGRAVGNKPLASSLARAKEFMYGADDVVDELDYCRLQQQVQGVMLAPGIQPEAEGMIGDGAEHIGASASSAVIPDNNGRKNRSKERDYFHITPAVNGESAKAKCIDCGTEVVFSHGTSVLHKHRNSAKCKNNKRASVGDDNVQNGSIVSTNGSEARKRIRTEGNVTTATFWDKAKFSERIHIIALELGSIRGKVIEYFKDSIASSDQSNTSSDTRVRTSASLPGKVYGRDVEKKCIMSAIEAAKSDNITVLPIVGIVGVGKTTLAKLVYNDRFVKDQFERIWVWVSNIFDEVRVTREILDVVTLNSHEVSPRHRESYEGVSNYAKLQEVLKTCMASQPKKILLVLDEVNDYMGGSRWKDLLDALAGSSCTKGNMIIVTTRNLSIAQRLGTVEPVKLGALGDDDFWLLFKACAVDYNNCKEHLDYEERLEIGSQIAGKLKGNPLAAESATEMLREQPTLGCWKNIVRNGVWKSLQLHGSIVTTLKNSYHQLPYQLQQCFLLCSIFPYNHQFHIDDLVCMWISLGFVKSIKTGQDCFNALVNSCLLEQVSTKNDILLNKKCYVMCGMMHELVRLVSRTEFATIDGLECKEVLPTVRHLSIRTDLLYHKDECGEIICDVKLEEKLQSLVSTVKGLRMLILIGKYDPLFLQSFYTFMCNSVNYTNLRYLKLDNKDSSDTLCISITKLAPCSGAASTSGRRPASAAPVSQSLLSQLDRHSVVIDLLIQIEIERHARAVLCLLERAAARRLRAAEAGLERALARNAELDKRLRQMEGEGQAWQDIARSHEDGVAILSAALDIIFRQMQSPSASTGAGEGDAEARRLRAAEAGLDRALARNAELDERLRQIEGEGQAWQDIARSHENGVAQLPCSGTEAAGEGDAEDVEQEHGAEASGGRTRACRLCGVAEACVVLLPCRHLCLCTVCEKGVHECPVCGAAKNGRLFILTS